MTTKQERAQGIRATWAWMRGERDRPFDEQISAAVEERVAEWRQQCRDGKDVLAAMALRDISELVTAARSRPS